MFVFIWETCSEGEGFTLQWIRMVKSGNFNQGQFTNKRYCTVITELHLKYEGMCTSWLYYGNDIPMQYNEIY